MANVKISDLTLETTPASTDLIEMEVGGVSKSVTIANAVAAGVVVESITNAKLAHIATSTIKGRVAAGSGDVEDLSAANIRTIINVADGANAYVHPNHSGDVTSVADGATTIAAKAVHVSMLADGTDGELITWGTDGVATVVAAGSSGQVLTSAGAGAVPSFAAVNIVGDTTPQLGGFLDMNKKYINITVGLADAEWCGITIAGTGGETLAFGEAVYYKTADSLWYKTNATATATSGTPPVGICVLAGASTTTSVLVYGTIRADGLFDTFTIGAPVYLSAATAGKIVSAAPTGTTNFVVRKVGKALTGNEVFVNPSEDYVELA
jgi:hypothetical protein